MYHAIDRAETWLLSILGRYAFHLHITVSTRTVNTHQTDIPCNWDNGVTYDVFITDHVMYAVDGDSVIQSVSLSGSFPTTPVPLVSAPDSGWTYFLVACQEGTFYYIG